MVNDMRTFLYPSLYRWISSVAAISACILCASPQSANGSEFISDIVTNISDGNSDHLIEKFDELEEVIQSSRNPLDESRKFLQSFLEEINTRYGLNLTIQEACVLVRENLHLMQIPEAAQNLLLETIALLESNSSPPTGQIQNFEKVANFSATTLSINWGWNWFGLNNKPRKSSKRSPVTSLVSSPLLQVAGPDKELPGTMYVGGVEAFAGALVFTLGLVFTPAFGIGTGLMVDGARRVFNGLEEMDKHRPPGSNQSSDLLNINF